MAAPQWAGGKCKSVQQAKAFFRHNDKERRMETQHTNPHIDKSKTYLNFSYRGLDYVQLCEAYDKRMSEIDQGRQSSGKNARTVLQSVVVYAPAGITDLDTLRRWFVRAGDVLAERFGDDFLDMQVDFDENHEYYDEDKGGMVMSREHGHARFVPEVDGKLNGKAFSSRDTIIGLNEALQEMSIREFGCPMMDGSKAKGGRTVESLKARSAAAEIVNGAMVEAGRMEREAEGRLAAAVDREIELDRREEAIEASRKAVEALQRAVEAKQEELQAKEAKASQEAARVLQEAKDEAGRLLGRMSQTAYDQGFTEFLAGYIPGNKGTKTAQDFIDQWEARYKAEVKEREGLQEPRRSKTAGKRKPKQETPATPEQKQPAAKQQPRPEQRPDYLAQMRRELENPIKEGDDYEFGF